MTEPLQKQLRNLSKAVLKVCDEIDHVDENDQDRYWKLAQTTFEELIRLEDFENFQGENVFKALHELAGFASRLPAHHRRETLGDAVERFFPSTASNVISISEAPERVPQTRGPLFKLSPQNQALLAASTFAERYEESKCSSRQLTEILHEWGVKKIGNMTNTMGGLKKHKPPLIEIIETKGRREKTYRLTDAGHRKVAALSAAGEHLAG